MAEPYKARTACSPHTHTGCEAYAYVFHFFCCCYNVGLFLPFLISIQYCFYIGKLLIYTERSLYALTEFLFFLLLSCLLLLTVFNWCLCRYIIILSANNFLNLSYMIFTPLISVSYLTVLASVSAAY